MFLGLVPSPHPIVYLCVVHFKANWEGKGERAGVKMIWFEGSRKGRNCVGKQGGSCELSLFFTVTTNNTISISS